MRYFTILFFLFFLACTKENSEPIEITQESLPITSGYNLRFLNHGGLLREYIVHVPASYTSETQIPVVLNFHGYGSNSSFQYNQSGLKTIAEREGFILVTPQGSLFQGVTHWNVGGWTVGSSVNDVDFVNTLIDNLESDFSIDTSRIYSTGMSNGGYMSFLLACQLSDRIAAIASVTGSMTPQTHAACNPSRPVPVMQIHGSQDSVVPYAGALWTLSIPSVLEYWISKNNCNTEAIVTEIQDIVPDDQSTVTHRLHEGPLADVSHFKVNGGNHEWPGQSGNFDINAAEEIWRFFSGYDIHGKLN